MLIKASRAIRRGEDYWRGVAMLADMWDTEAREDAMAAKRPQSMADLHELAARALCRRAGNPENTKFEGKPMWMSYLDDVKAVFEAIGLEELVGDKLGGKDAEDR